MLKGLHMNKLRILTIPSVLFAHNFEIDSYYFPLAYDEKRIEIAYLSEGELTLTSEGKTYTAHAGDLINLLYSRDITIVGNARHSHKTVGMQVAYELLDKEADECLELPLVVTADSDRCQKLIDEIIRTNTLFPELRLKCSGMCLELLNEVSEIVRRDRMTGNSGENLYVTRAKKYIFNHIHEAIRQSDVAEHLGITPEYLCAVFKKSERCSVMTFINRIKLNAICVLMEREGIPLYLASSMYGYSNPSYVSRLYRKYFSMSITDAVEKARQSHSQRGVWDK